MFFALELILGEIDGNALGMMLVASVASSAFTQAVSGPEPAFHIPTYAFNSGWEFPLYVVLGLLAGPISAAYIRLLYGMQDFFHRIQVPGWLQSSWDGFNYRHRGPFPAQGIGDWV